ncbi:PAS domain-containing sensor histidine kinase [Adhaeribacter rhizoryzae]|uniref:histidine kinase n=1 Tax=Adhaeribacter rhizoryzae TaxID=2607907 RepID=A0A5M6D972_9BACT|nr:PAS domain S-box protein [Adhaeribacter rhizoryzae]KAA5542469.1 PAS domain S-box protein [Adhaeribacter rhizoryzae]
MSGIHTSQSLSQTAPAYAKAEAGTAVFDQYFRVYACNAIFRAQFGRFNQEPIGQLLETLFPGLQEVDLYQEAQQSDYFVFPASRFMLEFSFLYGPNQAFTGGTLTLNNIPPEVIIASSVSNNNPVGANYWPEESYLAAETYLSGNRQPGKDGKQPLLEHAALQAAQKQLLEYENRLKLASQAARIGIWEWDLKDQHVYWNDFKYEQTELTPRTFFGTYHDVVNLIHPEDFPLVKKAIKAAIRQKTALTVNFRIVLEDASVRYINSRGITYYNEAGQPTKISGISKDFTSKAEADTQLAETQFLLQQVTDAMPDTLYLLDLKEKKTLYTNRSIAGTLGYTPQELNQMGLSLVNLILHAEDQKKIAEWEERLMRAKENEVIQTEYRIQHKNGDWRWINTRERVFKREATGKPLQVIGLAKDISDEKAALHELRSKTRLLNGILSHLPIAVWRIDQQGLIREAMGAGLQMNNLEGLKGENYFELFPELKEVLSQVLAGNTRSFLKQSDKNGERKYKQNYFYYDLESQQAVGFCLDVTELKQTQEQLKAQADFTQNLIDNSIDGIFAFDQNGQINAWNRVMEARYPLKKEHAIGKHLSEVTTALNLYEEADSYLQVLNGKTIRHQNKYCFYWNGYLDAVVVPLFDADKQVAGGIAFLHDVTERVKLEQERTRLKLRRQKEILNAILETQEEERRRIAESLHNGVGQILYATKLNLELLQGQIDPRNNELITLSGQISGLLNEAIKDTRAVSFELVPVILRDFGLQRALLALKQKFFKAPFDLYFHFEGLEKPLKKEYETAIYRIIQELLNNVIKHAEATEVHVHLTKTGRKIMITVEDNGRGFNHKDPDSWVNGIGLSSIHNRVKLFNGTLNINSQAGKGTIIEIDLKLS